MNDRKQQTREIERDEAWLKGLATPNADPLVVERVKYVVRTACGECHDEAPAVRSAIAAAKLAVRRELTTQRAAGRSVWRLAVPMLAAAAAVAFGVFRLAVDQPEASAMDPTFIAFVETMARAPDEVDLSLIELDQDVDELGDGGFVMSRTDWDVDWIDGIGENIDSLTDELGKAEETS